MNEQIEELLRQSGVEPSESLPGRVQRAVRTELRDLSIARRWRSVAATAAMAVLWIHLTWSAALNVRIDSPANSTNELTQTARRIQDLLPELSVRETQRMALQLSAGTSRPRWEITGRGPAR